jgi:hypothetical protein
VARGLEGSLKRNLYRPDQREKRQRVFIGRRDEREWRTKELYHLLPATPSSKEWGYQHLQTSPPLLQEQKPPGNRTAQVIPAIYNNNPTDHFATTTTFMYHKRKKSHQPIHPEAVKINLIEVDDGVR